MTEVEELQRELEATKLELRAVCQREAFFAARGALDKMTPWGDQSDEDRADNIRFYGWVPDTGKRVTHRTCPECKGIRPKDVVDGVVLSWCGRCNGTGGVRVEVNI